MPEFYAHCHTTSYIQEYQCQVMDYVDSKLVCYDGCLWQELKFLWSQGITTIGSCCGCHKDIITQPAYIQVIDEDIDKMLALGYDKRVNDFGNVYFVPKTKIITYIP